MPLYKFESTLKQRLLLVVPSFCIYPALIIGAYFLNLGLWSRAMYEVFLIFFAVDTLPALIVFTQYWLKNRSSILTIDTDKRKLVYETPAKQFVYLFEDISNLDYYSSYGKGSGMYAYGEYRYYKVTFKDKTEIIITCIMIKHIEYILEALLGIKAERHGKIVCFL
jgi:hypothetical protein